MCFAACRSQGFNASKMREKWLVQEEIAAGYGTNLVFLLARSPAFTNPRLYATREGRPRIEVLAQELAAVMIFLDSKPRCMDRPLLHPQTVSPLHSF
jgi:hypothetical protein